MGLGQFRDDPDRLRAAAGYLHSHGRRGRLEIVADMFPDRGSQIEVRLRRHLGRTG